MKFIYLDNSATSWPKPPEVIRAVKAFMEYPGASPSRGSHRMSVEAGRMAYECREEMADFFGLKDPLRVVFTLNATESINTALFGILNPGDHVVTTSLEHNAVMRPLNFLRDKRSVEYTVVRSSEKGEIDPDDFRKAVKKNTKMFAVNHCSNVIGSLAPVKEIGEISRERGVLFLVDSAQSAGEFRIDMRDMKIDLLAVTGHKLLYGPMGIGALLLSDRVKEKEIRPLKRGGTGSFSAEECQPSFFPDRLESGTMNAVGVAGLLAGLRWIKKTGLEEILKEARKKFSRFTESLEGMPGLKIYRSFSPQKQSGTFSVTVEGVSVSDAGYVLDENYGIQVRVGLHCSPSCHRTIGTYPEGTIRFAPGYFTGEDQIDYAVKAIKEIAGKCKNA
ncbi:aminotransferase class V-fold PLP-dependent enzyme [candidate division WOR-3 bacterium]|nr:aminotransferase class V-fold PLP-dependent enzyme [candidate division WOR-3 bacterium]